MSKHENHFSNADYAKKMMQKMQRLTTCLPPAILFEKDEKRRSPIRMMKKKSTKPLRSNSIERKKILINLTALLKSLKMVLPKIFVNGMPGTMKLKP